MPLVNRDRISASPTDSILAELHYSFQLQDTYEARAVAQDSASLNQRHLASEGSSLGQACDTRWQQAGRRDTCDSGRQAGLRPSVSSIRSKLKDIEHGCGA